MATCLYVCVGGGAGPAPTTSASPKEGLQGLIPTKLVSVTQHGASRSQVPFASYFSAPTARSNLDLGPGWAQWYRWSLEKNLLPVPHQIGLKKSDEIYKGCVLLPGIRSRGPLGHYFSQSLSFCRINMYCVHYITSRPSTLNDISCDIRLTPPFESPYKEEAHIKCWTKATCFSEPKENKACMKHSDGYWKLARPWRMTWVAG